MVNIAERMARHLAEGGLRLTIASGMALADKFGKWEGAIPPVSAVGASFEHA
jgi:hypothetical protein